MLERRARLLRDLRAWFDAQGVLEVATPLLARHAVTDPALHNLRVEVQLPGEDTPAAWYLQTSPEYALKRLLASGSGAIYQLGSVFRADEVGRWHALEFTMLEWYRPGMDQHALMDDVADLLRAAGEPRAARRRSYAEAFAAATGLDPHRAATGALADCAAAIAPQLAAQARADRGLLLDLLFAQAVAPDLGRTGPEFVYDFPAIQAALARVQGDDPPLARRFELFIDGVELANGFHELADPGEQRARFERDNRRRRELGLQEVAIDERLLAALAHGLPDCAGVALGVDRLLMVLTGAQSIGQVQAFDVWNA